MGNHYVGATMSIAQGDIQELSQYYARPRLLSNGTVPTSVRSRFHRLELSPVDIFRDLTAGKLDRLTGVFGLRFTLVFTLQVAATAFHQGLLAMSWQYGSLSAYDRGSSSFTATNVPHIRCDLSTDTMVTLRVPFLHYTDFVRKLSPEHYGALNLNALLPVASVAGLAPPTYKLYLHIEDMVFVGVSPNAERDVPVVSQSGRRLGKFEAEQSAEQGGTISRTLSWIASGIPSIISIAGKAGWYLERTAGLMAAFGFSKPQVTQPPMRVVNTGTIFEHNVDLPSQVVVVAPVSSNHLAVGPEFNQTEVDEMAFAYILQQYSQICVGSIDTSNPHGALIYGTNVSPCWFWARAPASAPFLNEPIANWAANDQTFLPSHQFYLSSAFRFWRGGFKFRFSFGKSKMHAGRVLVSFVPNPTFGASRYGEWDHIIKTPELNEVGIQPTGYTAIYDLKDSNVFEFEVPYTGIAPYTRFFDSIGSLSLIVMDPLQAPSVVSPAIPFLVEVSAMSDFELACPCGPQFAVGEHFGTVSPPAPLAALSAPAQPEILSLEVAPQRDTVLTARPPSPRQAGFSTSTIRTSNQSILARMRNVTDNPLFQSAPTPLQVSEVAEMQSGRVLSTYSDGVSQFTMGEQLASVKQLIMLPKKTTISHKGGVWDLDIAPWFYQPRQSPLVPLPVLSDESFSYGGYFASAYLFARGATDIHMYHAEDANHLSASIFLRDTTDEFEVERLACTPYVTSHDGALHVRVPSYQYVPRMSTQALSDVSWSPQFTSAGLPTTSQIIPSLAPSKFGPMVVPRLRSTYLSSNGLNSCIVSRSAGDDAMLAHYMGPPPLIYTELPDPDFPTKLAVEFQAARTIGIPPELSAPGPPGPAGPPGPPGAAGASNAPDRNLIEALGVYATTSTSGPFMGVPLFKQQDAEYSSPVESIPGLVYFPRSKETVLPPLAVYLRQDATQVTRGFFLRAPSIGYSGTRDFTCGLLPQFQSGRVLGLPDGGLAVPGPPGSPGPPGPPGSPGVLTGGLAWRYHDVPMIKWSGAVVNDIYSNYYRSNGGNVLDTGDCSAYSHVLMVPEAAFASGSAYPFPSCYFKSNIPQNMSVSLNGVIYRSSNYNTSLVATLRLFYYMPEFQSGRLLGIPEEPVGVGPPGPSGPPGPPGPDGAPADISPISVSTTDYTLDMLPYGSTVFADGRCVFYRSIHDDTAIDQVTPCFSCFFTEKPALDYFTVVRHYDASIESSKICACGWRWYATSDVDEQPVTAKIRALYTTARRF